MTMEGERPNASNDTVVVVPRGGGGSGSRGPRTDTVASAIEGGWYMNIYPPDGECEKMQKWRHGADIHAVYKDGKPNFLRLRQGHFDHLGHSLRKRGKSGQRQHFSIPTESFGKIDGSAKGRVVETWAEGEAFCIRIAGFYEGGQS